MLPMGSVLFPLIVAPFTMKHTLFFKNHFDSTDTNIRRVYVHLFLTV